MQEASRSFKISPVRPCKGWRSEILPKMVPQIDARIVCVRNRYNRKDWIALICTDMTIDENEIIRIYGKRWDIEVFFKTCKSFLKLGTEYHGLSYDALTAHTAFVFLRYMFMSVE
ncbi:transposase, partial [Lactobacillus delbrueckii]